MSKLGVLDGMSDTYVLVLYMLEELKLSIGSLTQYRSTKRLHNLLDGNRGTSELIL